MDELRKELAEQKNLTWEEKQSAEELIQRQEKIAQKVEDVARSLEDLVQKMDASFVVDQETFDKMQRISELLSEIQTDEMRQAMERLREAMKSVDPEEMKEAMNNLLMNQEELNRKLERTLDILERLKQEQEMKRLAEKASEIEKQHEALSQETEKGGDTEKLANEEENLRKETEQLKEDMEKLAEELKNSDPEVSKDLQELSKDMNQQGLCNRMGDASKALSAGQRSSASSMQKGIQKQLSSLSAGLKKSQASMMASRTKEIDEAMEKAQNDILDLSNAQEQLNLAIDELENSANASPEELARSQEALEEGMRKVAEDLYKVSQKSFFISSSVGAQLGAAARNMQGSTSALETGDEETARRAGQSALEAMNSAVKSLMQSRQSLCQSSSSCGLSEALEKLSGACSMQMGLNQSTQSLFMMSGESGNLGMQARADLARLAAEQKSISDQLSEIAKGLKESDQVLGDLGSMAKETEEIAKTMERADLSRELIDRQERILSRLLEAQTSLRKRDYSPKRKAEVGEDMPWVKGPGALPGDLGEKGKMEQKDLLKALKEAYPEEYEKLIRAYFKSLAK
jgi:myosin heavy subunit